MLTAHEPMRVAARRDMALGKSISPGPSIATPGVLHSTPTTIRKMGRLDGCHGKNRRLGVFLKYLVSYFVTCIRPALVSSGLFCLDWSYWVGCATVYGSSFIYLFFLLHVPQFQSDHVDLIASTYVSTESQDQRSNKVDIFSPKHRRLFLIVKSLGSIGAFPCLLFPFRVAAPNWHRKAHRLSPFSFVIAWILFHYQGFLHDKLPVFSFFFLR